MNEITFYWLPNCSTCQKAKRRLDRYNIKGITFRDIKEEPLSRAEVENLARILGGAGELFSRRAVKYREMKLGERDLSDDEMLDLMAGEYTFLKRPIVVKNGKGMAGYLERLFDKFLHQWNHDKF